MHRGGDSLDEALTECRKIAALLAALDAPFLITLPVMYTGLNTGELLEPAELTPEQWSLLGEGHSELGRVLQDEAGVRQMFPTQDWDFVRRKRLGVPRPPCLWRRQNRSSKPGPTGANVRNDHGSRWAVATARLRRQWAPGTHASSAPAAHGGFATAEAGPRLLARRADHSDCPIPLWLELALPAEDGAKRRAGERALDVTEVNRQL